ncbi:MAG: ABC transporter permease [Moraxella osloensis]
MLQVLHAWRSVFQDKAVLIMLLIAPLFMAFFTHGRIQKRSARHVPVAVVDYDHSSLSQTIISYAQANPRIQSTIVNDENSAKQLMWQGKIAGYMVIPGLYQKVTTGQPAKVSILANGNYFLLNKQVQTGVFKVIGTVSAGAKVQKCRHRARYHGCQKQYFPGCADD